MVTTNSNPLPEKSSPFVHGFIATEYDLAVLAQHYLDDVNETYLDYWLTAQGGSMRFTRFLERRLRSILDAIGCDAFDAAVESKSAKWRTRVTEIKVEGIRCGNCGILTVAGDCPMCGSSIDPEAADPWDLPGIWLTCK